MTAGVRVCSSLEMVEKMLETGNIQVLLIGEEIPYEERKRVFAGKRIVLTRQYCTDLGEEESELMKYQAVDRLAVEIMQVFWDEPLQNSRPAIGKGRILGVYSPVHRIGKTTFAIKLGKVLAQQENVLYLNLESYAGIGGYFREKEVQDLSHLLYYAKQEQGDISVRIASMIRQMGNLDYISPLKVWTDLRAVTAAEWESLLKQLTQQSIYDTVMLDIGNAVDDVFRVLRICDRILIPYAEDVYAKAKMEQYRYMLKVLKYRELEGSSVYVNMEKPMRQAVKETAEILTKQNGKERVHAAGGTAS